MSSNRATVFGRLAAINSLELSRDRAACAFTILFPLFFLCVFGFTQQTPSAQFSVAFVNQAGERGRAFRAQLSRYESVKLNDRSAAKGTLDFTNAKVAAVVTASEGTPLSLRVFSTAGSGELVTAYVRSAYGEYEAALGTIPKTPITVEISKSKQRSVFDFVFPGIVALALLQMCVAGTAMPLLRARESGTLLYLSLMPISRASILLAQVVPRVALALASVAVVLLAGRGLFHSTFAAGPTTVAVLLGTLEMIAVGYLLACWSSFSVGAGVANALNLIMVFGSSVFVSTEGVPWIHAVTLLLPLTPVTDGLRQAMLGQGGQNPLWLDVALTLGWTIVAFIVTVRLFRFEANKR